MQERPRTFNTAPKSPPREDKDQGKYQGDSDKKDWKEYTKSDQTPDYDRGGHFERSRHNDTGQHDRHREKH